MIERQAALTSLTSVECQQLLKDWTATQTDYPRDICVHHLFEAQVEQAPHALAVVSADEQLTYEELNARANRLAHLLQQRYAIIPGTVIGVYLEQSPSLIITFLAILKAGGAYLPLDLSTPRERIIGMLKDAHVPVVVMQTAWQEQLGGDDVACLFLDEEEQFLVSMSVTNPTSNVVAENPAYVIYTSGSIGVPKGVVTPHRAVNRTVLNTNYITIYPTDRVAQASTTVFDAATFEIWGALLNGAQLVLLPKDVLLTPHILVQTLRSEYITILFLTTALFNLIAHSVPDAFASLKYLLFGGEQVNTRSVRTVLTYGAPGHLLHVYGPTETTTFATFYAIHDVPENATTIPIGKPISNTTMYVLNEQFELVSPGERGELYIGGDGLALGYLDTALCAERFIPDPWGAKPAGRLYKTGDVVTYQEDGNVVFIGRYDNQVKIRGYRIELGEIVARLMHHPEVQTCTVIPKTQALGEKRLVAYVVPKQAAKLTCQDIREYLNGCLPAYMIPSAIILLPELPLNVNGKLDKDALLAIPESEVQRLGGSHSEQDDSVPHALVADLIKMYIRILEVSDIQPDTDFNMSGGDSLSLVLLRQEIYTTYSIELPLREILVNPTPRTLARLILEVQHKNSATLHENSGV